MNARRIALQSAIEVASRVARWCDFPSLLSAVAGQGKIRITSPISVCPGCHRHFEVVCAPCQLDRMVKQDEQVVVPFRAAGGGR